MNIPLCSLLGRGDQIMQHVQRDGIGESESAKSGANGAFPLGPFVVSPLPKQSVFFGVKLRHCSFLFNKGKVFHQPKLAIGPTLNRIAPGYPRVNATF